MAADQKQDKDRSVLVEHLEDAYSRLKKGPSRGTVIVLGLLLLGVALVFVWRGFASASRDTMSARWVKVDSALFPEQLEDLINSKDLKNTVPGRIARYKEARRRLHAGLRNLGNPETRKAAREELKMGIDQYDRLLAEPAPSPVLEQEAMWSVAKGAEALGQLDTARSNYQKLARKYPESALGKDAGQQVEKIDSDKDLRALDGLFGRAPGD